MTDGGRLNEQDFAALVEQVRLDLGDRESWVVPRLYRDSLALAVIDSIQSIGVRYGSVVRVLEAYRSFRRDRHGDPETDGLRSLIETFDELGGFARWASVIGNLHKTSTKKGAPLKAEIIERGAREILAHQIDTAADFREALESREPELKSLWVRLPGQGSGISWGYVTALVGLPSVKPDRMILGYLRGALGDRALTPTQAGLLLKRVAGELDEEPFLVDHNLWRLQSGRTASGAGAPESSDLG